jgi:hypothetical protein
LDNSLLLFQQNRQYRLPSLEGGAVLDSKFHHKSMNLTKVVAGSCCPVVSIV